MNVELQLSDLVLVWILLIGLYAWVGYFWSSEPGSGMRSTNLFIENSLRDDLINDKARRYIENIKGFMDFDWIFLGNFDWLTKL